MIRYTKDSLATVLYWWGGVNREILPKALVYLVFVTGLYLIQVYSVVSWQVYTSGKAFNDTLKGILSFLVFLLVFRLNQCMSRHYAAVALVTDLFTCLERLTVDLCTQMRADAPNEDKHGMLQASSHAGSHHEPHRVDQEKLSPWALSGLALAAKLNVIRLVIAYAVSILLHFQLLDAASDSNGELDDISIQKVVFLYARLRCLLYDEEMHLLDKSLSVLRSSAPGEDPTYRAEVNRYRLLGESGVEQLVGYAEKDRCPSGVTVTPAPKILMGILLRALQKPSDKLWGYESRLWNLFWRTTLRIVETSGHLESIICSPIPLPYLQHCRVLFFIFSMAFPLSIDPSAGAVDNIVLPMVIFWAIMGFEVLSAALENPLGNDEVDMNLFERIHSLEVNAEAIFDATELHGSSLNDALERTEGMVMGMGAEAAETTATKGSPMSESEQVSRTFRTYFKWVPMPTMVLSDLLESHGEVGALHSLRLSFRYMCCGSSIRKMLRRTLNRPQDGHAYVMVESTESAPEPPVDLNTDPNYFCHYLEFVGASVPDTYAPSMSMKWLERAKQVLTDHDAARLLTTMDSEDSERSLMCQGRTSSRQPMRMWERLS